MRKQSILRKGNFDSCHRIVNHPGKCANVHGHTYLYELEFEFDPDVANETEGSGYAIDFADIKSSAQRYIDDVYDHGVLYNPKDPVLAPLMLVGYTEMRSVEMYVYGEKTFCNPSVENIANQLFMEISHLMNTPYLKLKSIKVNETPNCWTIATSESQYHVIDNYIPKHLQQWKLKNQSNPQTCGK